MSRCILRLHIAALALFVVAPAALARQTPAAPAAPATTAAGRAFKPSDWYRLTTVGSPALSPDGKYVAFEVTTVKEEDNRRHSEVWMVPAAGGESVRLTTPGTESSNPRWSHDGSLLFFTSRRDGGEGGTWALRMDGRPGEAFQPKDRPDGSMPADGSFAVWTAPADSSEDAGDEEKPAEKKDDPYAKMQPMARPPFGAITRPLDPKRFDGRQIVEFPYVSNGRGFMPNRREAREWRPQQLWKQTVGDTAKHRFTDTPYSHRNAVVSPDGRWVAFVADSKLRPDSVVQAERDSIAELPYDAKRDEADRNDADIFIVSIDGGTPRRLTTMNGNEGRIAWSPDGKSLLFQSSLERTSSDRLWLVDVNGGDPKNLLGDWTYEPGSADWLQDGDILMSAAVGGRTALFRLSPETGKITEVIGGRRRMNGFTYDRNFTEVAYISTRLAVPTELYIANADGSNERKLTGFNDELNREIAWSDGERFTYKSVGGLEIEAWLMKPYGYQPGHKYPLVLYIHGGPHSAYGEGWFDEFQDIAGAGMWVLFTNPRGSSGYGADFTYSTRGRWGMEDYEDLMKAVDIVAKRPDVDSARMGVTGGSYGGFMTAWVTTKTNRFKAAQVDRMISDWGYWYGSSDAQGLTEFEFYGKPWDNWELYDSLSPIRHVANVRTPTLLVQSEEDHRTPMGSAEEWFMALEKQGVPAEFIRYPRSTHELSRSGEPWLLVDRLGRLRQWFSYWLDGPEKTVAAQQ